MRPVAVVKRPAREGRARHLILGVVFLGVIFGVAYAVVTAIQSSSPSSSSAAGHLRRLSRSDALAHGEEEGVGEEEVAGAGDVGAEGAEGDGAEDPRLVRARRRLGRRAGRRRGRGGNIRLNGGLGEGEGVGVGEGDAEGDGMEEGAAAAVAVAGDADTIGGVEAEGNEAVDDDASHAAAAAAGGDAAAAATEATGEGVEVAAQQEEAEAATAGARGAAGGGGGVALPTDSGEQLHQQQGEEQGGEVQGGGAVARREEKICRGAENLEVWGDAIVWGANNLVDSPEECCQQCQERCAAGKACDCNSWVYCGDKEACGENHRQCWLKKQKDVMEPDVTGVGPSVPWMTGFFFPPGEGVVALETAYGAIRIKLQPTWAPLTVGYIRDLVKANECTGCHFYRAEGLGSGWNDDGTRKSGTPPGPPYALVQGSLASDGVALPPIPQEGAPIVRRGDVCLVGSGPDFFVALGDHPEWEHGHTVFGTVVEDDLVQVLVGKLLLLPTRGETWGDTKVQALEEKVAFRVARDISGIVV